MIQKEFDITNECDKKNKSLMKLEFWEKLVARVHNPLSNKIWNSVELSIENVLEETLNK